MTFRTINDHEVNAGNKALKISVTDEPGSGGANHKYMVTLPEWTRGPNGENAVGVWDIDFQNGPINVDGNGVNGLTHEVLLAIVADRLRAFQKGPYACKANACALTHIEEAMHWLQQRTIERMRRGVEGTHTV